MCSGSLPKKMLLFALPLMFSSILQLLFNAADLAVAGKCVGDTALAAIGSTGALINLLTNLFMGLSVGANVLVIVFETFVMVIDSHRQHSLGVVLTDDILIQMVLYLDRRGNDRHIVVMSIFMVSAGGGRYARFAQYLVGTGDTLIAYISVKTAQQHTHLAFGLATE